VLIRCATVLDISLQCSAIFYSARPFYDFVSHLPLLQCSAIFDCYNTRHFPVLQCSAILSQCSVICDHVRHFRVARTGSGSRERTRLNCVRTHGSIGYVRRTESRGTEPHVRWSRARHGVTGVGSVARMFRSVWMDRWVQVMNSGTI
jgi:hypothetical protein